MFLLSPSTKELGQPKCEREYDPNTKSLRNSYKTYIFFGFFFFVDINCEFIMVTADTRDLCSDSSNVQGYV